MTFSTTKAPKSEPIKARGPSPAFFSAWDLHSYYGESYIVQGVSFDIREGEILALLGRNGAGKTSTLRSIARAADPEMRHGEVWLDHKPIHTMKDYQAAQEGIQLVPEDRRVIPGLTVQENLELSQIAPPIGWSIERIYEHFPRLAERRNQIGTTLSGGEQQMLALARILRTGANILLLDEITEGLAPVINDKLADVLVQLKERGLTILLVEQNFRFAAPIADRHYVMEHGHIVEEIQADELEAKTELLNSYLGV